MMRRLAVITGCIAVAIAVVLLTVPWWLGVALVRIGPSFGLTIEEYHRNGYSRFAVSGAEYRRDRVLVTVDRVEADTPLLWLWRRWTSRPGKVVAGNWTTVVSPAKNQPPTSSERGWVPLQRRLHRISGYLAEWIPQAQTGAGVATWPGGELTFSSVTWQDRVIACPDLGFRNFHGAVSGAFKDGGRIETVATLQDGSASAVLRGEATTLSGKVTWWDQPAEFAAQFAERGWLPLQATLRAENWELPGDRLKLGAHYAFVRGHGTVEWRDGRFSTEIAAEGQPLENSPVPPLTVNLRGHGAKDEFVAESLDVSVPGIEAHLSAPVAVDFRGRLRSEPSTFTFKADLAQQPWFAARGALQGDGRVQANAEGLAMLTFSVGGENVAVGETALSRVEAKGAFEWPALRIESGSLAAPDGSEMSWQGGWNFRSREVLDAAIRGRIGRALLARWLPEYPEFGAIDLEARASGPWATAKHDGRAQLADLRFAMTHPMAVKLDWSGEGDVIDAFAANLQAGDTTIAVEGSADRQRMQLTTLTFANGEAERLRLTKAVELQWIPELRVGDVELTGPEASIRGALDWGAEGNIQLRAQRFRSEWLRALLIFPPTNWTVDVLEAVARWENGPAFYSINAGLNVDLGKDRSAQLSTELKGTAEGLEIVALRVAEAGAVIVNASGQLPIVIQPASEKKWIIEQDAPFTLNAATSANPSFWETITQLTGVDIVQPQAMVRFDGTLRQPRGEARLSAARVAPVAGRFAGRWPKIEALDVHVVGDKEGATLEKFAVAVEGQAVRVSGKLPVSVDYWRELMDDPRKFAQRGRVRVEIPDAQISAFVHYFPQYIAPKGRFHLDLTFDGEEALTGYIRVDDATSLPLGPLGVLQEINADIRFSGRTANLQAVTARMGGQLVTLQGSAQLPVDGPPQLNFTLTGENLPFVRRAGLLVRGDLDLQLITPGAGPPVIQGVVRLRDSLFLADLRALLPSGAKGVASRPPYFALENPPLNKWGLNVTVEGEKFFRLRTPVFNGTASARFRLDGTLGEPRIAGEAKVDQGNIRLPFANFTVRQGEVRLSPGQVEPQIFLAATTRRYGYDLRMELTGNTSSPNLTFSSSPPLEAEQVLLMVMAGEAPRNEISTTDRQRMARFGAFFGQSLLGSLGGDSTGADRLTISSGGDISEQGRETYNIEYRLDDRWALTGEYDEFDDYYGGLKWRIYPKGEKSDEKN